MARRPCSRCGRMSSFASTGKFRLNANGSKLDAWLIYCCVSCGNRWNRSVFERRPLASIPPDLLLALQSNDAALARSAFAGAGAHGVQGSAGPVHLKSTCLQTANRQADGIDLAIQNPDGCAVRLDQLLAKGLGLSRKDLKAMVLAGALELTHGPVRRVNRIVPERCSVRILRRGRTDFPVLEQRALAPLWAPDPA